MVSGLLGCSAFEGHSGKAEVCTQIVGWDAFEGQVGNGGLLC